MHIPDNYLSPQSCAVLGAAMIPVWALAVNSVTKELQRDKLPLLGIAAAFSFLIMMFNVPLPGGTSGHAVGGTLLALLLGPWSACIAISVALLIQALLFGDGGILSFAANCFNMAFALPFMGYYACRLLMRFLKGRWGQTFALAFASWAALCVSALLAAIEFGLQPLLFSDLSGRALYSPYPLTISIPAMVIPHLLVAGGVEALFTVAIYRFLSRVSPDSLTVPGRFSGKTSLLFGILAILICLSPLGLIASSPAWGEWDSLQIASVVQDGQPLGFIPEGMRDGFRFSALIPDYALSGIPEAVGYLLSAAAGAASLVIVFKLIGLLSSHRRKAAKK